LRHFNQSVTFQPHFSNREESFLNKKKEKSFNRLKIKTEIIFRNYDAAYFNFAIFDLAYSYQSATATAADTAEFITKNDEFISQCADHL
jgi:hypothetical protein